MPGVAIKFGSGVLGLRGDPPPPPENLSADATGETAVVVTWADEGFYPTNSTSFRVEISDDDGQSWATAGTTSASPFDDTGLSAGTDYLYRVVAINFWGESDPSPSTPVTTHSAGPPAAPSGLTATALSPSSIGLAWVDNADNETGFELQRDTVNTFDADPETFELGAGVVAYTDSGLAAETEFFYRVRAVNGSGDSSYSATDSATTEAEGSAAAFSLAAVPDATVGVTAEIAAWIADAAPTSVWLWYVRTHDLTGAGDPGLIVGTHSEGALLFAGDGAFGFTENTASYGVARDDFPDTTNGYLVVDLNHDGSTDMGNWGAGEQPCATLDPGDDSLTIAAAPWAHEGTVTHKLREVEELQPSGFLRFTGYSSGQWPTTLSRSRIRHSWNGTGYTESKDDVSPDAGIPAAVIAEMESYLDDGSLAAHKRFMFFDYVPFDLTGSGSPDDLIVVLAGSYGAVLRGWYLTDDGDGTYTDRTSEWGLPATGFPVFLRQKETGMPFTPTSNWADAHLHVSVSGGAGRPDLFLENIPSSGGESGHYRWNGTGYTKLTSSPLTAKLGLDDSYQKRLYAVDLTNSGRLDLVLSRPRSGNLYVFLNDGSGNFTEYSVGRDLRHWDADGLCIDDLDGDGLPDFVMGGDGGTDSGVTSGNAARCLSVWENTTTDPGNYFGVLIRRTGREATNYFGVGARIDVHTAGQSFSAASLIRRWHARPDGLPLIFGVGSAATVDLRVTWGDSTTTDQTAVNTNQTVTVTG